MSLSLFGLSPNCYIELFSWGGGRKAPPCEVGLNEEDTAISGSPYKNAEETSTDPLIPCPPPPVMVIWSSASCELLLRVASCIYFVNSELRVASCEFPFLRLI